MSMSSSIRREDAPILQVTGSTFKNFMRLSTTVEMSAKLCSVVEIDADQNSVSLFKVIAGYAIAVGFDCLRADYHCCLIVISRRLSVASSFASVVN